MIDVPQLAEYQGPEVDERNRHSQPDKSVCQQRQRVPALAPGDQPMQRSSQLVIRGRMVTGSDACCAAPVRTSQYREGASDQMTDPPTAPRLQDLNTTMLASAAVLVGLGAALGLAGVSVGAAAFIAAARSWYQRNDLTPAQHAKLTWEQARAAAVAGSDAWKGVDRSRHTGRPSRRFAQ